MSTRHLVLGFDGADLELVLALGEQRLPHFFALMRRGVYAHQASVIPPATLPNWTTFLTGVNPGEHGVFDFTTRRGYDVRFTAGSVREAPTLFARLDRQGLACACIGFPATWPPERLAQGIFMSGWDAPVAFEADRSFVWPPALHDLLLRRFGPVRFDEVDQFHAERGDFHARLGAHLADKVARRSELARFLLALRAWDVFAFYFGESDTAAHNLYSLYDEGSPRRPHAVSETEQRGLPRVYEALDRALGELVEAAGPEVEVTLLSDHGSGGSSDKVFYLNRALAELGFLRFKPRAGAPRAASALKQAALTRLPPRLRERLFRLGSAFLPSLLESRARYGNIDMARTRAFSDELNYFPNICLNQRGREPRGTVPPQERERALDEISAALLALRDPDSQRPLVSAVHRRETLFSGPHVERAPDLLLELRLDRGYSYNLLPSPGPGPIAGRLSPEQYLGRKGRSLPGSHRPHGLMIAAGPRIHGRGQIALGIEDTSALVLARMGLKLPSGARGKVPVGVLEANVVAPLPEVAKLSAGRGNVGALEARLRALGYID
jgi:predicted AlkP superfamily phosphohydrolase/phosphomutase